MSEAKINFDEFVDRLKRVKPQLNDDLTDKIMNRMDAVRLAKRVLLIDWIRIVSSSAAVAFICLFMYLKQESGETAIPSPPSVSSCYDAQRLKNLTVADYLIHLQKNREANERLKNLKKQAGL